MSILKRKADDWASFEQEIEDAIGSGNYGELERLRDELERNLELSAPGGPLQLRISHLLERVRDAMGPIDGSSRKCGAHDLYR